MRMTERDTGDTGRVRAVKPLLLLVGAATVALVCAAGPPLQGEVRGRDLPAQGMIAAGDSIVVRLPAPRPAAGEALGLELDARLQAASFSGSTLALLLRLNGVPLRQDRLANKPLVFAMANGSLLTWADGDRWRVVYSPDFDARRNAPGVEHQVLGASPYHIQLRIDDLIRPESNRLVLYHIGSSGAPPLEIAALRLAAFVPSGGSPQVQKTGIGLASPRRLAGATMPTAGHIGPDGAIQLALPGGRTVPLQTDVSVPGGGWRHLGRAASGWERLAAAEAALRAQSADLTLDRRLDRRDGCLEVTDTFTNHTRSDLGLIVRYTIGVRPDSCQTYLGGMLLPGVPLTVTRYEPQAPCAVAVTSRETIGLLPANDVLWLHAETFRDSAGVGLLDGQMCIAAGASVQLAWRALACYEESYEDWLNLARAATGANFTLDGGFAFGNFTMNDWPVEQLRAWIQTRALHFLSSPAPTSSASHGQHGSALLDTPSALTSMQRFASAAHAAAPGIKVLGYFHAFINNRSSAAQLYADTRIMSVSGTPIYYPYPSRPTAFPLFAPIKGSAAASDLERVLAKLWELGFDGVYWDEMSYSDTPWTYGSTWDGASGDVDRVTHRLIRRKSGVPLLVQPWMEDRLAEMAARERVVVGNTEPVTVTLRKFHFPRFVETATSFQLLSTHLWSPIGLGDRLRERTAAEVAARVRDHLEHGVLYYFYMPYVGLAAPNLTAYMYPSTPIELHAGTILAEERILTSRPGRFGWGDGSRHEVHVFDPGGLEIPGHSRTVEADGVVWTELDLGPGQTAAVLRLKSH